MEEAEKGRKGARMRGGRRWRRATKRRRNDVDRNFDTIQRHPSPFRHSLCASALRISTYRLRAARGRDAQGAAGEGALHLEGEGARGGGKRD